MNQCWYTSTVIQQHSQNSKKISKIKLKCSYDFYKKGLYTLIIIQSKMHENKVYRKKTTHTAPILTLKLIIMFKKY